MNWAKYLMNQMELDCREAWDQGYEFHFNWLLILIAFIAWEMSKGATFSYTEPFKPMASKFNTLWYSSDMNKWWQSNFIFHTYYNQLKVSIQATPRITLNTLHRFTPLMKFNTNHHFIYIVVPIDALHSYYKLTKDDLDKITKEWSMELLVSMDSIEMFDVDSPKTTPDTAGPSKIKKT
jgi:hypothetical protein